MDQLITDATKVSIGGTDFVLYPTTGGETSDALMVYLLASGVLFTGDVMMPYLGAPFFAEGSPEGLLGARCGSSPRSTPANWCTATRC